MKHIGYVAATLAASCALVAGSAWADGASSSVNRSANDRDISREIASDLIKDTAVGPYGVWVKSRNGVVQLTGSVGTVNDWKKANRDARNVDGVAEVQNDLSVLIR